MSPAIQLRQWLDSDLEPFAAMNADSEVMRFFPSPLSFEESRQAMQRFRQSIDERGWGLWAVEVNGDFAGFTGLAVPRFTAHFTPCIEIGWRLRRDFWAAASPSMPPSRPPLMRSPPCASVSSSPSPPSAIRDHET